MRTTRRLGAFSGRNDAIPGLGERWFCLRGAEAGGAGIIAIYYERRIPKVLCLQVTVEINISLLNLMPRSRAVVHVLPRASAARGCYSPRLHRCRENIDPHVKSTPKTVRRAREPTGMSTSKTPSRRRVLGVLLYDGFDGVAVDVASQRRPFSSTIAFLSALIPIPRVFLLVET